MIRIEVAPTATTDESDPTYGYVLRVLDGNNGNVLLSSGSQGYANPAFVQSLARRLFPDESIVHLRTEAREAVVMVTTYRDGSHLTEALR